MKTTHGRLVWIRGNGVCDTLYSDLPFAVLQAKRQELINSGQYRKETLKLKYMQ